jgi:hypothetical protein
MEALKVLKVFSFFFCISLFCWLVANIYDKFSKKLTNIVIAIDENTDDVKDLPCFTACPWNAFKKYGFHYKPEDFRLNTYDEVEIFGKFPDQVPLLKSLIDTEEIKNIMLGRCYMFCQTEPAKKGLEYTVAFRKNVNLKSMIII